VGLYIITYSFVRIHQIEVNQVNFMLRVLENVILHHPTTYLSIPILQMPEAYCKLGEVTLVYLKQI
jgi:hypothetical protein